jgi:hypothetical protein
MIPVHQKIGQFLSHAGVYHTNLTQRLNVDGSHTTIDIHPWHGWQIWNYRRN